MFIFPSFSSFCLGTSSFYTLPFLSPFWMCYTLILKYGYTPLTVIQYVNLGVLVCLMVLCDDLRRCRIGLLALRIRVWLKGVDIGIVFWEPVLWEIYTLGKEVPRLLSFHVNSYFTKLLKILNSGRVGHRSVSTMSTWGLTSFHSSSHIVGLLFSHLVPICLSVCLFSLWTYLC